MPLTAQLVISLVIADVGDYLLQSDWQANEKTKGWWPALVHALLYTLCFLVVTRDWRALAFIGVTHLLIDHYRLARHVCWAKNFLAPRTTTVTTIDSVAPVTITWWYPWSECSGTGYHKDRPPWMTVWLMIKADNTMHHMCNFAALWAVHQGAWT